MHQSIRYCFSLNILHLNSYFLFQINFLEADAISGASKNEQNSIDALHNTHSL